MSTKGNVPDQYLAHGDPALKGHFPAWVNNLADDASVEGSMLDGVVQGADVVRSVVLTIRSLYEHQEFRFAGPYGDNGLLEDYVAEVNGEPIGCVVLVTRNAVGQTSRSWRVTGRARRCCSLPACWARGSPAPRSPSTSSPGSPQADRNRRLR